MNLTEYVWKASYQIVLLTPNTIGNNTNIEGWGSGFILKYKNQFFFITCDHNLHMLDDYENGKRTGQDFNIGIICNYQEPKNPYNTVLIPIPGFYYFDGIDIQIPELMELKDITFAKIAWPLPRAILTNTLCDHMGNIIVHEKEPKIYIDERTIGKSDKNGKYVIAGCIRNKIKGLRMERYTTYRAGICYTGKTHLGLSVFENPDTIIYDDWVGLSGSPVFNEKGQIIGMLNEVSDKSKKLYVTPIQTIIQLIDYTLSKII